MDEKKEIKVKKSRIKKTLIIVTVILIIVSALLSTYVSLLMFSNGKIAGGTTVSNINIAFKTKAESKKILKKSVDTFYASNIPITVGNKQENFKPENLGITIYGDKTINEIIINETKINKTTLTKTPITNIIDFYFPKKGQREMTVLYSIDKEKLQNSLNEKFNLKELAPKNATFEFDESGEIKEIKEKNGQTIDINNVYKKLENNIKNLETGGLKIELKNKEAIIKTTELEDKKTQIEDVLKKIIVLQDPIYSTPWKIKMSEYKNWLEFNITDEGVVQEIIKQEELNKFIDEEVSKWLDKPVDTVKIYKNEKGNVEIEGEGADGIKIEREELKKDIETALRNNISEIVIPVSTVSPKLEISKELQDTGIVERIGVGHTSFYGSHTNRIYNIKTGASKFNGTIVEPNEIFSFTKTLGPVNSTTGYRPELVIKKEGTVPEYGGGLCQVSTTMYRTVLFSGLPIVERHPHSYAVSYYSQILGHGLDATIYIGGPDLKFKNDTGHPILIQAYVKNDYELYFIFYGTSPHRKVRLEGPIVYGYRSPSGTQYIDTKKIPAGTTKQVEIPHTGFSADWYRYITNEITGETTKEFLKTTYKAIPRKVLRGIE